MSQILCHLTGLFRNTTVSRSIVIKQLRDMHSRQIIFEEYGDPMKVTKLVENTLPDNPDDDQV